MDRDITVRALRALAGPTTDHRLVGSLLNDQQELWRSRLGVSTHKLDRMIEAALDAGAYGAKTTGSGEGCCILAYEPTNSTSIKQAVENVGAKAYVLTADEGTRAELLVERI